MTAQRFLAALPMGLRTATVEDVRDAIVTATVGASTATARQYTLRIKSLLSYGHELGYMPFNAGVRIKVQNDAGNRGASLAKRIMTPAKVALLIRAAPSKRDRILIEVAHAGGLRVSEIVNLTWADVLLRENDLVQLSILGKGEKPRQVLLPEIVSRSLPHAARRRGRERSRVREPQGRPAHRARCARDGEAHGGKGRRQCCDLPALAATRARFARHR